MLDLESIVAEETAENDLEEVVMGLIINSGQARSLAYAALKQAKQGDFVAAKTMMEQSRTALNEAHLVQTKLIESDQWRREDESESGAGTCAGSSDDLHAGTRAGRGAHRASREDAISQLK